MWTGLSLAGLKRFPALDSFAERLIFAGLLLSSLGLMGLAVIMR
jgi:hypothetical protein